METEAQETIVSLNISLPRSAQDFIEREIAEGGYSTPSDYIRALVEEAHSRKAEERLEKLLLEGLDSGAATPMTQRDWDEIKQRGLACLGQQPLHKTASPAELAQAFWEWAESHDHSIPPLPLAAVSRDNIYDDR